MRESRIVYTSRERGYKKSFSRRKAIFILAFLLLFFTIGGAIYLLRLPRWQVQKVQVEGLGTLREEEVIAKAFQFLDGSYAYLIPRRSVAVAPIEQLEHFLRKEFPIISSVNVDREYPHTLKIYIKERELWAMYCVFGSEQFPPSVFLPPGGGGEEGGQVPTQGKCVYIDETGFAYEKAPNSTGSLILKVRSDGEAVSLASQAIPSGKAEKLRRISEVFKQKLDIETVGYELFSKIPDEARAVTAAGFKIWLKLDDDIENTAKVLKTVLDEEIKDNREDLEYIDARFGNKVFYKLR